MIRLSMLQFRVQAITAAVTLAAFAVLLAATGPHLVSMYAADGLDSCHGSCLSPASYFTGSLSTSPYGRCSCSAPGSSCWHPPSSACSGERR
jgi:hypothetical protein